MYVIAATRPTCKTKFRVYGDRRTRTLLRRHCFKKSGFRDAFYFFHFNAEHVVDVLKTTALAVL